MKLFITSAAGLSVAMLVATLPARAAQVVSMDLQELSKNAEVIAVGRCTETSSAWNAEGTHIYTTITIQVSQYLKGFLGPQIQFRQLGGKVGEEHLRVPGMPIFSNEEQVIVFLARDKAGRYQVLTAEQGKFSVVTDPETGISEVKGNTMSSHVLTRSFTRTVGTTSNPSELNNFINKVKSYVGSLKR